MKLSDFQLYCLILILVAPVAYLETPHTLIHILYANAWLAVIAALFPGLLLVGMYAAIIRKSSVPFPLMLEEHLGKVPGMIISVLYIPCFILVCSYTLRLFIEFMKMIVFPATPISVFIGVLLFVCLVAIKTGLENIARVMEMITFVGVTFSIFILIIAMMNGFHPERLLPIGFMNYAAFTKATLTTTVILGKMMPVLTLAFLVKDKTRSLPILRMALFTFIPLISLTTMGVVMTRGILPSMSRVFPVFAMIRLARIGAFIQNLDIFFIAIWILGIFGSIVIPWFMACYTTQTVFDLKDYRFVAAPSVMIIGVLSILIGRNNLEVVIWSQRIIPAVYTFFFIGIPLVVYIVTLFKAVPADTRSGSARPEELRESA
ncbi:MAG: GerAB/ArcD/ProY family transporter [Deltaproteobacteria bacterium]